MRSAFNVLALFLFLANPAATPVALAIPVTFQFAGSVYLVDSSVSGNFSVGDTIFGSYTFESDTTGHSFAPGGTLDPSITYYPGALTSFEATIGSYFVGLGGANRIFAINDDSAGRDRYLVELLDPVGADIAGLPIANFFLSFQDNAGLALSDGTLPVSDDVLMGFPSRTGALDFVTGISPENRVTFSISSITQVMSVPEPSTLALFGLGLAGLGFARRRQQSIER